MKKNKIIFLFLLSTLILVSCWSETYSVTYDIYNNRAETITFSATFLSNNTRSRTISANTFTGFGTYTENPKPPSVFFRSLTVTDEYGAEIMNLTGSAIDEAFIKDSDYYYYRLDVN